MEEKWEKDNSFEDTFYKIRKINNTYYKISLVFYFYNKSIKVNIGVSSGNKRKHLDSFEPNDYTRDGGVKALVWVKEELKSIPEFIESYYFVGGRKKYLCIRWVDAQRRDVYSRLQREGFYFVNEDGERFLIKKV